MTRTVVEENKAALMAKREKEWRGERRRRVIPLDLGPL